MADNAVADLEASDALSDLDDLASEVAAGNERVFDPGEHHVAYNLFDPVNRIDSYCAVLDDNLVLAWRGVGGRLDLERSG